MILKLVGYFECDSERCARSVVHIDDILVKPVVHAYLEVYVGLIDPDWNINSCAFAFYIMSSDQNFVKDFDVGNTYKMKVVLTNISYTINTCKLIGLTEKLKDFITVEYLRQ